MSKPWTSAQPKRKIEVPPLNIDPLSPRSNASTSPSNTARSNASTSSLELNPARTVVKDEIEDLDTINLDTPIKPANDAKDQPNELYFTFSDKKDEAIKVMGVFTPKATELEDSDAISTPINSTETESPYYLISVRVVDYLKLLENDGYKAYYVKTLEPNESKDEPTIKNLINFNCAHLRWISGWAEPETLEVNIKKTKGSNSPREQLVSSNETLIYIKQFVNFVLEFWFRKANEIENLNRGHYTVLYQWLHVLGEKDKYKKPDPIESDLQKYAPPEKINIEEFVKLKKYSKFNVYLAIALNLLAKEKIDTCAVIPIKVDNPLYDKKTFDNKQVTENTFKNAPESAFNANGLIHILSSRAGMMMAKDKSKQNTQKRNAKSTTPNNLKPKQASSQKPATKLAFSGGSEEEYKYKVELTDTLSESIKPNAVFRLDEVNTTSSFFADDLYLIAVPDNQSNSIHFVKTIQVYDNKSRANTNGTVIQGNQPKIFDDDYTKLTDYVNNSSEMREQKAAEESKQREDYARIFAEETEALNIKKATEAAQDYLNFEKDINFTTQVMLDTQVRWWRFAKRVHEQIVFSESENIDALAVLNTDDENLIKLFNTAYHTIFNNNQSTASEKYNEYFVGLTTKHSMFIEQVKPIIINAVKLLFTKKIYRFKKVGSLENQAEYKDTVDNTIAEELLRNQSTPESVRNQFLVDNLDLHVVLPRLYEIMNSYPNPKKTAGRGTSRRKGDTPLSKTIRRKRT